MRPNDGSHHGTEWLHVKILEAKLALEQDPDWLAKHSVLGADFRADDDGRGPRRLATDHTGREKSLAEIEDALVYQLRERLEFVRPPDPTAADLLFDLSNVLALTRSAEHAAAVRALSLTHGPEQERLASGRTAGNVGVFVPVQPRGGYFFGGALAAAALLVAAGFYFLFRRRRLQRS